MLANIQLHTCSYSQLGSRRPQTNQLQLYQFVKLQDSCNDPCMHGSVEFGYTCMQTLISYSQLQIIFLLASWFPATAITVKVQLQHYHMGILYNYVAVCMWLYSYSYIYTANVHYSTKLHRQLQIYKCIAYVTTQRHPLLYQRLSLIILLISQVKDLC